MTVVKICGITMLADALDAADAGADMLGLNFYPPSPRYLSADHAGDMANNLRAELGASGPLLVGVFVNASAEEILDISALVGLDAAQLSGDEPPGALMTLGGRGIKALRPPSVEDAISQALAFTPTMPVYPRLPSLIVDAYHPDLYGGTGDTISVEIARVVNSRVPRMMLAGGLTPENVAERAAAVGAWGVDVASGVEGEVKGRKDPARVRAFISAVKN